MKRRQVIAGLGAGAAMLSLRASSALARHPMARGAADPYEALRMPGAIALMRHAEAPGVGDPPGFNLESCATQRNLDDNGRAQARRIGEALKAREIVFERVLSSPWCRCLETARLVTGREPEIEQSLGSFFGRREQAAEQLAQLQAVIGKLAPEAGVLLVTHQVVITGLSDVSPAPGEMVAVSRGEASARMPVIGRIKAPG